MARVKCVLFVFSVLIGLRASLLAADRLVVIEAESTPGLGADFVTATDAGAGVTYITAGTDLNGAAGNQAPGVPEKVASYTITFPQAGTYNLYLRIRMGPSGGADDSFYYGNGFGAKSVLDGTAWILVNNNTNIGFTALTDTVTGTGSAGVNVWKWVRFSGNNFSEAGPNFVVPADALTQTFQLGTRENGLDFDRIAFGLNGTLFTVADLLNTAPSIVPAQVLTAYDPALDGDVIGIAQATDINPGTTLRDWTITGGTGAAVFGVVPATGQVTVADAAAIDATTTPLYTLDLSVSDGVFTSAVETITVELATLDTIAIVGQPDPGVYSAGDVLSFVVALNRPMTVDTTGGTPRLALEVGAVIRYAGYVSGSGSDRLTFTSVVAPGDDDADGIALVSPLELNGGIIVDDTNAAIGLGFTPPDTGSIRVDSTPPAPPLLAAYTDNNRTLTGTAEAGSTVEILLDGVLAGAATANALGNWSFVINATPFPSGSNFLTVTATATDAVGNVSALSADFAILVVIDPNAPVIVPAESGARGADFNQGTAGGVTFITAATNFLGDDGNPATSPASRPNAAAKVVSYTVTFPQAGSYDLYARIRVGGGGADDDSFYYGNGFGAKDPVNSDDWILANQTSGIGFTAAGEWVTALGSVWGGGGAANNVFKWIKLSGANLNEAPAQFIVPDGARTQTFQVGSRENGLDLDQFAFARDGLFFTVGNLNAGAAGTTVAPPPPYDPTHPPLATGKAKFLGSAWSNAQAPNFDNYFNQVTPENAGKWGSAEPTRDVFNWTELDTAYNLAKSNGWPFRFHILVWGNQQPQWIESLSTADQLEEIKEWFAAVAGRYPDIDYLEVVNEPLHDSPAGPGNGNYLPALLLSDPTETGEWAWVINAFKLARFYFPDTPLMINEFGVENDGNMMPRYIGIINQLQDRGLIDLVGVQGHAFNVNASTATLTSNINNLANSTGLPIQVTELDIDGLDETFQAAEYQRVIPIFWEHPSVMGITLWGYRPGHWRTAQGAPIVRANGSEEPAMLWLKDYITNANPNLMPIIDDQPVDQVRFVHETASFSVAVLGHPAPSLQWQWSGDDGATWVDVVDDGVTFSGANTTTLVVSDVSFALSGARFHAVATNAFGVDISKPALLTVHKLAVTAALVELELTQTYDGAAVELTVVTDPPGLPVIITYNGSTTPPTAAGTYAVVATVNSPDYAGAVTGTLVIEPAEAGVTISDLVQPYDGTPRPVTVTTAPSGLPVVVTYNGAVTAPTYPGTYDVVAVVDDPNYVGSAAATLHLTVTALVRHAPIINGDVAGSIQLLLPESVTFTGATAVSGDLLLPGTPSVRLLGSPTYGGTIDGPGAAAPTNHRVTLLGNAVLGHVVRRVDPIALPVVAAPASPTGTRTVILFRPGQSAGNFATVRHLTLLANAGSATVPPGSYGTFIASGNSAFTLGIAGAETPAIYNFQWLTLNNGADLNVVGPVIVTVGNLITLNDADAGAAAHPEWLSLRSSSGGVLLNDGAQLNGHVVAPNGTVILNGNAEIFGSVTSDRLVLNGNSLLEQADQ